MGKSVREHVRAIVCEQFSVSLEKLTDDMHFVNDLGADSLGTVEFIMELEDELDLSIPDEDEERISTVNDAVAYIEWAQNGKQGANPLQGKKRVQEGSMVRTDGL